MVERLEMGFARQRDPGLALGLKVGTIPQLRSWRLPVGSLQLIDRRLLSGLLRCGRGDIKDAATIVVVENYRDHRYLGWGTSDVLAQLDFELVHRYPCTVM